MALDRMIKLLNRQTAARSTSHHNTITNKAGSPLAVIVMASSRIVHSDPNILGGTPVFVGIRAADALHVASAIDFDAEVLISVDEDALKLDGAIVNKSGVPIKFCDTDVALTTL